MPDSPQPKRLPLMTTSPQRVNFTITAVEEDDEVFLAQPSSLEAQPHQQSLRLQSPSVAAPTDEQLILSQREEEDYIPGPPKLHKRSTSDGLGQSPSHRKGLLSRVLQGPTPNLSNSSGRKAYPNPVDLNSSGGSALTNSLPRFHGENAEAVDQLQLSDTGHKCGSGLLANRADLELPPQQFAAGCNLLQAAAIGDRNKMEEILQSKRTHVNFRDYDRRTALHVAASEGHLAICQYLVIEKGARINRSDRWGGSPLDDAHRHRHHKVVEFLREHGALTGSGNRATNLITAAAIGDLEEVCILLQPSANEKKVQLDVNSTDYDKRTALHLAAGEGHYDIVKTLCDAGANVNLMDRWRRRPLDDAIAGDHKKCAELLLAHGAIRGVEESAPENAQLSSEGGLDLSNRRVDESMKIEFEEIEMIDKIGAGAFGEIYKCKWRETLVACKIIKSAKIRRDWINKHIQAGDEKKIDDAIYELDNEECMDEHAKDMAIADFRREISVLKSLRHPHIVLLLAYSTTEDYECLLSELMKCSLLDIFKSHVVHGTQMSHRTQILYATQLALGMNYLHTCRPPIIHRDLKPANLLIDYSGVLKISDFGLSKVRPNPGNNERDTYKMTGETGSYRFMAPEVFRHEEYNETVDVYSYAMIFFYLLVGRPPWPQLAGIVAAKKAAEEGNRPTLPRFLDMRLQSLVKECWDDNPSVRPPFNRIANILSSYNRDVFKHDVNSVIPSTPPPSYKEAGCNCVIQ